eukprot:TRINITY_DN4753_c0_g1_i1.p2 TRINITY_DN4753_c0_g1~~TRINITY_DN4753_c0_g1_i1.p2  ORF type:complete len:213 (+),score=71.70 TRINITY_DN4753_c0_g1_i1:44-640(+)
MYKSQPEVNRLLADKWHDYTRRIHLDRLRRMKPDIDNREPPKQVHLRQNLKRAQQLLERSSQIERDNRKLLLKMSAIMQRSALDNKNEVEFKSLNRNKRKQELQRITKENQAILTRIQQKRPAYNTRAWEKDFAQSRKYLDNTRQVRDRRPGKGRGSGSGSGGGGRSMFGGAASGSQAGTHAGSAPPLDEDGYADDDY